MIREQIQQRVTEALVSLGLPLEGVVVEYIEDASHGDITTNAAMVTAKAAAKAPRALAEELIAALGEIEGVEKVDIAGPGFINFTLAPFVLGAAVQAALDEGGQWGKNESLKDKKVMVEYTDPNPFKEFHIGHLMSNAIGESVARLLEYANATVSRANYQGDVGPHVAKALWGLIQVNIKNITSEILGRAYAAGAKAYEEDITNKEVIDTINQRLYSGFKEDPEIGELYIQGRTISLEHFEDLYKILGTKFDHYFFESDTAPVGMVLVMQHPEVFEKSDGAIVYKGEQDGLHTRVFITKFGTPTYEAKDLGLLSLKGSTGDYDELITVTANEQTEYFKVMCAAAMRIMPELAKKMKHITHGMMRLPTGKMSSRTGDVITGESLLFELTEEARARASETRASNVDQLAQWIAVAAIKYQILKQGTGKDMVFDKERALSLEGDSGPYIQYAYARARSIVTTATESDIKGVVEAPQTEGERALARLLLQFPDVVKRAQNEYEPHHIATYAAQLAGAYNSWYAQEHVLGTDAAPRRVALTHAVAITLRNALYLLGIEAPEKM